MGQTSTSGNKLRTYRTVKRQYECENYIRMKLPPHFVASIAKLRISAHDLEIERGRYFTPSIPANMRFCKFCKDIVENEIHFVTECPL
jgi:hypothetical protein